MYVLTIVAIVMSSSIENPVNLVTRPSVKYYENEVFCKADIEKQRQIFLTEIAIEPALLAAKCIKVVGPEGSPT